MSKFTLSIFDPNTLLPHRAGIAGLVLALSVLDPTNAPLTWEVTEDSVKLAWEGNDQEVVKRLLDNTYQITEDGYLDVPALNLDDQGLYTFSQGLLTTFLQHNQQRKLGEAVQKRLTIEEGNPEIQVGFRPILSFYYGGDFKEAFNSKGRFNKTISLKSHHLPGLDECFVNGTYKESPEGFLALLFLPLACGYYKLPAKSMAGKLTARSAVAIPEVTNLLVWCRRRQELSGRTYRKFCSSSAGESALSFLLQENFAEDAKYSKVDYCEVYQLGKQSWNANQFYIKQAVYRVQSNYEVLRIYEMASTQFSSKIKTKKDGESWLAISKVLPWICDNLVAGKAWYAGFFEFHKRNEMYERGGLVKMTDALADQEKTLFDTVQGAFSAYLRGQIVQAQKQGRKLDYGQVTDKVIYRMQRPSTQQEFATALVDFLSQFRSKASRGVGLEVYQWLHGENWRQARDLTLLAIATYTSKKGDALDGQDIPIESSPASEAESDVFEMSA
jgi:CRISPR-associated protein Cas8a1/Csx13